MDQNIADVSRAFSKQAELFDKQYQENKLSEYLRSHFRQEILSQSEVGHKILELNCGTGLDALFFAQKGYKILATDNAPGMLEQLSIKIYQQHLHDTIRTMHCSYHDLTKIQNETFDYIISDFGGLNCTDNLKSVLEQFTSLLNPKGKVTLMIMPRVTPWEIIMFFKGDFKTAFRRFKKSTPAHIEGVHFNCYYYNPRYVIRALKKDFKVLSLKGIFITVPPEFFQNFVERYPRLFSFLSKVDKSICKIFPFTYFCDHYMITLEKK